MRTREEKHDMFSPQYSTKGFAPEWDMCGVVQSVKENKKMEVDYVRFNIENPGSKYYIIFSITVPFDLDIALEPGDSVHIQGTTRTWTKGEGATSIELVATSIDPWNGDDYK